MGVPTVLPPSGGGKPLPYSGIVQAPKRKISVCSGCDRLTLVNTETRRTL